MSESLAVKYRPKTWDDVVEADVIKKILNEQIQTGDVKRVILFTGPAGCGKTSNARIFARVLESCDANVIELNCADKNGVDDVRNLIINQAKSKPLQGKLKVFIADEVHMLTAQAQNALLKLLEEPPAHCIFILCTTDPQKILSTILSRAYRYDFQLISYQGIINRLNYILTEESKVRIIEGWSQEALSFISRTSGGHLRDAITLLDKTLSYTKNISVTAVTDVLGVTSYDLQFELLGALLNKNENTLLTKLEEIYRTGKDLKLFCKNFLSFVLDVKKYITLRNCEFINIPDCYESNLKMYTQAHATIIKGLLSTLIKLNADLKWETNPKTLIESTLLLEVL